MSRPNVFVVAGSPVPGVAGRRITVGGSATTLNHASVPFAAQTEVLVIDVQGADVMVTFDGSTPSTSNGHYLSAGDKLMWTKAAGIAARLIAAGSSAAEVHVSEFAR